jgi:hypothetical protein
MTYTESESLLGFKLITYDNGDVLLYCNDKVEGYGKQLEESNIYRIYSEGCKYYSGVKVFEDFASMVRFFNIQKTTMALIDSGEEYIYWT